MDDLENLIVIGDRVLVKPSMGEEKSRGGLYLPVGYQDKEEVKSGYVLKCGPGYPLPTMDDESESWTGHRSQPHYLPLQVKAGDLAIFMAKNAVEIKYCGEKYLIVPQSAILMVERCDE